MKDELKDEVAKLQMHKNAADRGGALDIIREKELAINAKVLEARKQAEDIVAQARRDALAIKEKAAAEGPKEAQAYFDAEVAKARKEADKIKGSVDAETNAVMAAGMKNLDKAVSKVLEVIIP